MLMRTLLCFACAKMELLNHHLFTKKAILGTLSCCKTHISIVPLKNLSKYAWESVRHSRVAYGWKIFSDYKPIVMQTEYCLRENKQTNPNPNMHLSYYLCVKTKKTINNVSYMQNYEPACETGEIKDEIKRQAFISTSISCKYFALTALLIGGWCL